MNQEHDLWRMFLIHCAIDLARKGSSFGTINAPDKCSAAEIAVCEYHNGPAANDPLMETAE